jgi:hypothetical protein
MYVCTYLLLSFSYSFSSILSFLIVLHKCHFPQIFPYTYLSLSIFSMLTFAHFLLSIHGFSYSLFSYSSLFSRLTSGFFYCFTSLRTCPIQKVLNEQLVDSWDNIQTYPLLMHDILKFLRQCRGKNYTNFRRKQQSNAGCKLHLSCFVWRGDRVKIRQECGWLIHLVWGLNFTNSWGECILQVFESKVDTKGRYQMHSLVR